MFRSFIFLKMKKQKIFNLLLSFLLILSFTYAQAQVKDSSLIVGNFTVTKIVDGGYILEVMIPFTSIKGKSGVKIGFDLQINDDAGNGSRSTITKWNDPTNDSYQNTSGFGTLILE